MNNYPALNTLLDQVEESLLVQALEACMDKILDADCHPADINKATGEAMHLTPEEQKQLNFLLKWCEYLFDGTLGKWKGKPVALELKEGAKPYPAKPFPIPHSLEAPTRQECE